MNSVLEDKQIIKSRVEVAYDVLKEHALSDSERLGAIGYCFGGALVLNMARMGMDLRAVVSFHGALDSFFSPSPGDVKAKVLVCHGEADEFISYQGAFHGFTNPAADERGRKFNIPLAYNKNADINSWKSMQDFFENIF